MPEPSGSGAVAAFAAHSLAEIEGAGAFGSRAHPARGTRGISALSRLCRYSKSRPCARRLFPSAPDRPSNAYRERSRRCIRSASRDCRCAGRCCRGNWSSCRIQGRYIDGARRRGHLAGRRARGIGLPRGRPRSRPARRRASATLRRNACLFRPSSVSSPVQQVGVLSRPKRAARNRPGPRSRRI